MRSSVTVATDDCHPGLRETKLWADDVNDPLFVIIQIVQSDTELVAIITKCVDLLAGDRIGNR